MQVTACGWSARVFLTPKTAKITTPLAKVEVDERVNAFGRGPGTPVIQLPNK
jgi:hypothetical protein